MRGDPEPEAADPPESNNRRGPAEDSGTLTRRRMLSLTSGLGSALLYGVSTGRGSAHLDTYREKRISNRGYGREASVETLIGEMRLEEKTRKLHSHTPANESEPQDRLTNQMVAPTPRLEIPGMNMTDGPAGIARDVPATSFPAPVAQAATWDPGLVREVGRALGREAKATNHGTVHAPAVNIARVPVCGRNFEYFGEDPHLTSRMAVAVVEGVQSTGTISTIKHFACNNQETDRFVTDARVDERTLREIYLPAFRAAVEEADVASVMAAYNRVNGEYCCQHEWLLQDVLKGEWGFEGYVRSDGGGNRSTVKSATNGLDFSANYNSTAWGQLLQSAVERGEVPEARLDDMLRRLLGEMDEIGAIDGAREGPPGEVNTTAHQELARRVAERGAVLLRNRGETLPLEPAELDSIAVLGPESDQAKTGGGGSSAVEPPYTISPLEAIESRVGDDVTVRHASGDVIADAVVAAARSDVALVFADNDSTEFQDRLDMRLNDRQNELIRAVTGVNDDTGVVLTTGGPIEMPWLDDVRSVLQMWYPGMEDGNATARVLFGEVDPSGRLPITFGAAYGDYPANPVSHPERYPGIAERAEYSEGLYVGYRHFDEADIEPLFPFGHGRSYTAFSYEDAHVVPGSVRAPDRPVTVQVTLRNTGDRRGREVVQVYLHDHVASIDRPMKELAGFEPVVLDDGETRTVTIPLADRALSFYDATERAWITESGRFTALVGRSARDIRLLESFEAGGDREPVEAVSPSPVLVASPLGRPGPGGEHLEATYAVEATEPVPVRVILPDDVEVIPGSGAVRDEAGNLRSRTPTAEGTVTVRVIGDHEGAGDPIGTVQYRDESGRWRDAHGPEAGTPE